MLTGTTVILGNSTYFVPPTPVSKLQLGDHASSLSSLVVDRDLARTQNRESRPMTRRKVEVDRDKAFSTIVKRMNTNINFNLQKVDSLGHYMSPTACEMSLEASACVLRF